MQKELQELSKLLEEAKVELSFSSESSLRLFDDSTERQIEVGLDRLNQVLNFLEAKASANRVGNKLGDWI